MKLTSKGHTQSPNFNLMEMDSLVEQSARCYSESSRFQNNSGYQFLQQLSPVRGSTVLDLGCGTGYLAAALSECVGPEGKVIAVDPDGERLKIARENYARDNIEYVNGNDATFPEGPYDLVFANQVMQWVAEKDALFGRLHQSLKSGGRFAFTTFNGTHVWPPAVNDCVKELFGPDFIANLYHKRMTFLTCGQYQELAVSHGFVIASMEDREIPGVYIDSVNALIEFFFGLVHGELDRTAITEQALQSCRERYEEVLRSEAELHLKVMKVLHVVLTKP